MTDPVIELAQIINSTPEFTRRINDFVKAKGDAETATKIADQKKSSAEVAQQALDQKIIEHRTAMTEATRVADTAGAEAARRIELANRMKADHDNRERALDARERGLSERESVVQLLKGQFEQAIAALGKL